MKVLWVGDAVVSTGFARCTHAACDALVAAGHEVHVIGINFQGDPHDYPYKIYPAHHPQRGGRDAFGVTRLPVLIEQLEPDVVVLLQDPWNLKDYRLTLEEYVAARAEHGVTVKRPLFVGWLAVDGKNQPGDELNWLDHVIVWTGFAGRELAAGGYGGSWSVVPLGHDPKLFHPASREAARAAVLPEGARDCFIVGAVGRNQLRKRLDLTLKFFADWVAQKGVTDARLLLHVAPTGEGSVGIERLTRYYGLAGKVMVSLPHIGEGSTSEAMLQLYNALDVYVTTTQGEGWGLPCLEAMACGTPCIVPDWSGLGDWVGDAAVKVRCTTTAPTAPMNTGAYTLGGIADGKEFVLQLDSMYRSEQHRLALRNRGLARAAQLTWEGAGRGMVEQLEWVLARAAKAAPVEGAA